MNEEIKKQPPYVAYTTFKNFLASLNKNGIIPSRIDKTLMPGYSGSAQSFVMAALRFFDLIDKSGAPTNDMQSLVRAEADERKQVWNRLFTRSYAPIIGELDLSRATLGMLNEKFSQHGLTGDTLRKCESFLAAAAEDAGIPLAPQLKPNTRGGGGGRRRKKVSLSKQMGGDTEDEFTDDTAPNGGGGKQGKVSTLLLDSKGERQVKVKAPASVTNAELERIQKWLSFQLIVSDEE